MSDDFFSMRAMTPDSKDRLRLSIQREICRTYQKLSHEPRCTCDRCSELEEQIDMLQDTLDEIDDPFSNNYITWYV